MMAKLQVSMTLMLNYRDDLHLNEFYRVNSVPERALML